MKQHRILVEGGALYDTFGPVTSVTYIDALLLHVNTAPTTSENFTLTFDSAAGGAFDTVLYKIDLSTASTTDVFWTETLALLPGDALRVTYANTDGRTLGVTLVLR